MHPLSCHLSAILDEEGNMYVRPSVNVTAPKWLSSAMCAIPGVGVDVGCGSVQLSSRVEQFCGS